MIKIICVCGARPNFMKIAPLMKAFKENGHFEPFLVHTGQHYDEKMSELFSMSLASRNLTSTLRSVQAATPSKPPKL